MKCGSILKIILVLGAAWAAATSITFYNIGYSMGVTDTIRAGQAELHDLFSERDGTE